ncbi:MAG: formyltransferase family protein [Phycisphaeraceae bacterium]
MTHRPLRCLIVASTAGSVANQALINPFFRGMIHSLVADHPCAALDMARAHGLPVQLNDESDPSRFCAWLLDYLRTHEIDYVFSFYTQFYSAPIRAAYQDRLINLHPSLLPAFKGMDGFGDTWRYGARFAGNTFEFIDQAMDEGKVISQACFPLDPATPVAVMRHRLFIQACRGLLQVARWLSEDRIRVEGRIVTIAGAAYNDPEYSPALDFPAARTLDVPFPAEEALAGFGLACNGPGIPGTSQGAAER